MKQQIVLKGVDFYAYHGVFSEENAVGGTYEVNMVMDVDFSLAMREDELSGTINYQEVYQLIEKEMSIPSKLIEHVVGRICNVLFNSFSSLDKLTIGITKKSPPIGAKLTGMEVVMELTRTEWYVLKDKNQSLS